MNFNKIWKFILILFSCLSATCAYRAVVLVHGILSDAPSMMPVAEQIILVRELEEFLFFVLSFVLFYDA